MLPVWRNLEQAILHPIFWNKAAGDPERNGQFDKLEFGEVMDVCSNKKKMIAPIIITVIMVLYYVVYFGFLITLLPSIWKYALGIIPLGFSVVMVKVCIERINEIKKGEEDDISKY